ncbi:MAG TPA: acetyl-CoA C-acetyltransferase [Thermoanaerobaculia bacterium]|nr:acetyl-CoA C-acetyltransferase [Thermoanaerobaculia bacterium]
MADAYILDAVRTPRGRGKAGKGALSGIHSQELMAQVLNGLAERSGIDTAEVDDVVVGCVSQAGEQGANIARNAVLAAGWPIEVTGVSLNRFCGSGLQAVSFAAMGVASGYQKLAVAGGVESMSRNPIGSDGAGQDGNNLHLRKKHFQVPQGISADLIATLEGFSREQVDAFALESQRRAAEAEKEGRFRSRIPVRDPETGQVALDKDEHMRPDTTAEGLAALAPSFVAMGETWDPVALEKYPQAGQIRHVHTAGNSSGVVDGAAAVLLASEDYVKAHGAKPRARIRALATVGSEPVIMLTAPTPASRKALEQAGMQPSDIDLWEINEAFAAVPMQTIRNLGIDPEKVNVNGGAIALGHPLGATGAMLLGTALDELERRGLATALVTLCIGGGQGIAAILERV